MIRRVPHSNQDYFYNERGGGKDGIYRCLHKHAVIVNYRDGQDAPARRLHPYLLVKGKYAFEGAYRPAGGADRVIPRRGIRDHGSKNAADT